MPGVPRSKACDACHGLKKKCDQAKPKCSRCARLGITCAGAGRQRYIFKLVKRSAPSRPEIVSEPGNKNGPAPTGIATIPSNELTVTVRMLVDVLEIGDVRYSLGCYGDFLRHIPGRLGRNDALDASVRALVTAFPFHYTGCLPSSALVSYGHALTTLRLSLQRTNEALTAETLCAIYLVMISQGWIGRFDHHRKTHGEILAHLMNSAAVRHWREGFELDLLVGIWTPVIFEAVVNPAIQFDLCSLPVPDSRRPLRPAGESWGPEFPSIKLQRLARLPSMFQHPELCLSEIQSSYCDMQADHLRLLQYFEDTGIETVANDSFHSDPRKLRQYQQYLVVYAVLLNFMTGLNYLLRNINPGDPIYLNDSYVFASETIALAQLVSPQRPLGSSYIPPCLAVTWATTDDTAIRAETGTLLMEYQNDFPHTQWMVQSRWLKRMFECCTSQLTGRLAPTALEDVDKVYVSIAHNKAAFGLSVARILL